MIRIYGYDSQCSKKNGMPYKFGGCVFLFALGATCTPVPSEISPANLRSLLEGHRRVHGRYSRHTHMGENLDL